MKKETNKIVLGLMVFVVSFFSFFNSAIAQVPPNPEEGNLTIVFNPNPLFGENDFLPGDSQIGEAIVTNNTDETKQIGAEAINYPTSGILNAIPSDDLSLALEIVIREKNGNDLYGGTSSTGVKTLSEFFKNGEAHLSDLSGNGASKIFEFIISFPTDKQDEWQEKTTRFDIIVGFQGENGEIIVPQVPAVQTGGGGSLPPGLIIQYTETSNVTDTTATISWFTSYKSTSQVVFCEQSDNCFLNLNDNIGNPPLYGYNLTTAEIDTPANPNGVTYHEMTLTGLEVGTTYEYRSISHASPPTISRKYEFTTLEEKITENETNVESESENNLKEVSNDGIISNYLEKIKDALLPNGSVGGVESPEQNYSVARVENNNINESGESEITEKTSDKKQLEDIGADNIILGNSYPTSFFWIALIIFLIVIVSILYMSRRKKMNKKP